MGEPLSMERRSSGYISLMACHSSVAELAGPSPVDVEDPNVGRWLRRRGSEATSTTAVRVPDGDQFRALDWDRVVDDVMRLAEGLIGAGVGIGDRVVVIGPTSYEWTRVDLAVMSVGGMTVPVYDSASPDQCRAIVERTEPRLAFAATDDHVGMIHDIDSDLSVHRLDPDALDDLAAHDESTGAELEHRLEQIDGSSIATIVFTSGTTGEPKGAPLTHHQLLWTARQTTHQLDEALGPDASTLLFLPLAHIFARHVMFAALEAGVELCYGRSIDDVPDDLRITRPTFLLVVPRMLERVIGGARKRSAGWRRPIFDMSIDAARAFSKAQNPGLLLRLRHRIADRLVLRKLREGLGGRVQYVVSGGARLDPELAHTISGAGITVLEGYGLTETTAPVSVDSPKEPSIGTVGFPLPGLRVRITGDHEIQVCGPSVIEGYLGQIANDDDASSTNPVTTVRPDDDFDGAWFRTGDQGEFTEDGRLVVKGRAKEVIVTDGGEMVAPAPIEDALRGQPGISQAMVVGDDRPHVAALLSLDDEAPTDDERRAFVEAAVGRVNSSLSRHEAVRQFRIVDRDFTEAEGELTPTMKLKRDAIEEHFADDIAAMYDEADERST
ncbi:MAG: long-chain fatty acid--CoA ligase [Ilumatobacter sp.]|nr:MAG: long-chain fatty acid--CoA ligase [Ilumatobacter sp.]